eukprot:3448086-Rhodomonas_salina.2
MYLISQRTWRPPTSQSCRRNESTGTKTRRRSVPEELHGQIAVPNRQCEYRTGTQVCAIWSQYREKVPVLAQLTHGNAHSLSWHTLCQYRASRRTMQYVSTEDIAICDVSTGHRVRARRQIGFVPAVCGS